jgi:hypothetical protein
MIFQNSFFSYQFKKGNIGITASNLDLKLDLESNFFSLAKGCIR